METPVCLSHNFVNKQNVRSYNNILKSNLLKSEDPKPFLCHVLGNKSVSEISPDLIEVLSIIRSNLRTSSKEDFNNYFTSIKKEGSLSTVGKTKIFESCWTALTEIIPRKFFGSNQNLKVFKLLVNTSLHSMRRQHFLLSKIVKKWDFTTQPWKLFTNSGSKNISVFHNILLWMINFILSPMICLNFYVTTCKLDSDENKLFFFWKNEWQSYYDKKISDMIFSKTLKRCPTYCLGKKSKKSYATRERLNLKLFQKDIPKLHFVLKSNKDCRPIVRYKNNQTKSEKYKIKERLNFLKLITGSTQTKVEIEFERLHKKWTDQKRPKLYFIKTDLSNAFGLINKEKLIKFLCQKHLEFQKNEKNSSLKKKVAQEYKELMSELRKPLLVRAGNTVYEWTEGLVQGYKYSPALSELYYTCLDEIYLAEHLQTTHTNLKLFTRVVDDYLYITDSKEDAMLFLAALSKYRNINYEKTFVNFEHETIKTRNEITFLGYSYNTDTLEVGRASNAFFGLMCYKITFSAAVSNLNKFLDNRIGQSGIQINGHMFNFAHNSEELIWRHVFTTFCLSANKFCTILSILCEDSEMSKYLLLYKKRVAVKMSNKIIGTLMKSTVVDYKFMYCINHFRYLAFKALYLCARNTPKCTGLVPLINTEVSKCNCLYGKWRQHACRIETNGEVRRLAVREICSRQDLRNIVKSFDVLPSGIQCYHRNLI